MRTLIDLFEKEYLTVRCLSQKAINCYMVSLRHFDRFLAEEADRQPGPGRLDDLSDLAIARFVAARERKTSRATAKRDRTQIACLWRFACRRGYLSKWPDLVNLRVPKRVARAYKIESLNKLYAYFATLEGEIDGVPKSDWWTDLVRVLFECATRIGETMALEWTEVDLDARQLLFRAENRKMKTHDIVRDISPQTAARLARRAKTSGRVFPWPKNATFLWWHMKRHCERAGVQYLGFHGIRKSACSYTKAGGGDATKLADHSSPATTEVYIDPTIAPPESNLARLPGLGDQVGVGAEESAMRDGFRMGKQLAATGRPQPTRAESLAMAALAGHATFARWYSHGMALGWDSAQDRPAA